MTYFEGKVKMGAKLANDEQKIFSKRARFILNLNLLKFKGFPH
jgi:hypothetical protein